eukprot:TRINITY_DN80118_c0_g1_i1.p1 TRINITY_DN80118_c0_g1~~TRINITY_DN80118_c0_g1_i1.p1  ORF type:complete len:750 (-),score=206.88 TRINITY_DN80118_c0_g1_i1:131-2380(-)
MSSMHADSQDDSRPGAHCAVDTLRGSALLLASAAATTACIGGALSSDSGRASAATQTFLSAAPSSRVDAQRAVGSSALPSAATNDTPPAAKTGSYVGKAAVLGCLGTAAVVGVARRGRAGQGRLTRRAKRVQVDVGEKVVGIDLGTTNSVVAVLEAGRPTVVPNAEGRRTTPSVVAYSKSGEMLVGEVAKRQAAVNAENSFASVKRFMGRTLDEVGEEVNEVSYKVDMENMNVRFECPHLDKNLTPEEVAAKVLRKLSDDAASYLKADVRKAVVTVPAYFNDSQRKATKNAGAIAGLKVLRIINEPTAASLAYGLESKNEETIMVFDLGGGTFDVSVLKVGDGVCEVMATNGDTHLGGDDFDRKLVEWLASDFELKNPGIKLLGDRQALQRLTEAAEKAKVELSDVNETTVSLPFIYTDEDGPRHLEAPLERKRFNLLCKELVERCRTPVEQALEDAELKPEEIAEVVLVGGSTRIPAVKELARDLSGGRWPNQSVNPDEVVALGAALQAGVLTGEVTDLILLDVTPLSLGVETHDGMVSVLIPRNTRIPTKMTKIYTTAKENQKGVEVKIKQGERMRAKDNKGLGLFRLSGILPAPMGVPQIEVTFDIGSDGTLNVSARDQATQKEMLVTVDGASTLTPEDLKERVEDAQASTSADEWTRWTAEVRNDAETLVYKLGRLLREQREKLDKKKSMIVESKLMSLQDELDEKEPDHQLMWTITQDLREELKEVLKVKVAGSAPDMPGGSVV